uniref:RNA uridylyltransferase n=1 Tax=Neobodo designis TaxID=312471 RepID=A0A7S1W5P7_NEODS|mmetsp:Transcript_53686/g.165150  ORF Transcript_53686/g.165150 Transcript_53686/m.165150 type:complete len:793 (+) Transcript_53686:35-2413(+)
MADGADERKSVTAKSANADNEADDQPPSALAAGEARDTCDLCNKTLHDGETMDSHLARSHEPLLRFAAQLEQYRPQESAANQVALTAIGKEAIKFATNADGGPSKFRFVQHALTQLRAVCKTVFPSATLFAFGSCLSLGCYDGDGDVDLTLVDPDGWIADPPTWPPKDEAQVIKKLARALRSAGFQFEDLEPVLHTRVPIIRRKLETKPLEGRRRVDEPTARSVRAQYSYSLPPEQQATVAEKLGLPANAAKWNGTSVTFIAPSTDGAVQIRMALESSGLLPGRLRPKTAFWESKTLLPEMFLVDFDLSARAHGVRNSLLIRAYMNQSPLARAGSVFVKRWSKRCGLNNSLKGFITSYAVTLLWIHFLVVKGHVKFVPTDQFPARPDPSIALEHVETVPAAVRESEAFALQLGLLLRDFYRFYAYEFDWSQSVVSVSQPTSPSKERLGWTLANEVKAQKFRDRVWYRMCIEDPFEHNLNLGRHLSPNKVVHALSTFRAAVRSIDQGLPAELLADYTSPTSLDAVCRAAAELLIGAEKASRKDLFELLFEANPRAVAAMTVEHADVKLFHQLDMDLAADHETASYPTKKGRKSSQVISADIPLYEAVKKMVAQAGAKGWPVSKEAAAANLTHTLIIVDPDSNRAFASTELRSIFLHHMRTAQRVVSAAYDAPTLSSALAKMETKMEDAFDSDVAKTVLTQCAEVFTFSDGRVRSASSKLLQPSTFVPDKYRSQPEARAPKPPPAAELPPVTRGELSGTGPCSGCRRSKTTIWPTSDPDRDPGWYCETCWAAWQ